MVAANAVVLVDCNGKIPVRLYNFSNNEIKMYKGIKLGNVEIFQEEDGYFRSITTSKNSNNEHVNGLWIIHIYSSNLRQILDVARS